MLKLLDWEKDLAQKRAIQMRSLDCIFAVEILCRGKQEKKKGCGELFQCEGERAKERMNQRAYKER